MIECVANFSEGRDATTIAALQAAIRSVDRAHLLDTHVDADHNRCVLTFIAPPPAAKEAAFRAIATACKRIDMRQHRGVHPRIGAADVIPFVPLEPEQMFVCVAAARALAERVGSELSIPVYCYGEAAFCPERRRLERIRRGQYEALRESIANDYTRAPDFGPACLGTAGASAIGARGPLIAFNVYLTSADISIARSIAHQIRESSGGLPQVKALGLLVGGRAQVSMNLTNFRHTSLTAVIGAIEREAARANVTIDHSELIGLLPRAALLDDACRFWHLPQLDERHILEARIEAITGNSDDFLSRLASPTMSAAGVSAAARTGALAAALLQKVAAGTARLRRYAERKDEMQKLAESARALQSQFMTLAESDALIVRAFQRARKSGQDWQAEARAMTNSPMHCVELAGETLSLARRAAERGNANARADSAMAGELALAVSRSAAHAARANLPLIGDAATRVKFQTALESHETRTHIEYAALNTLLDD